MLFRSGYGVLRYVEDRDALSDVVRFDQPLLGDLGGKRAVHLQCHIGTDTLSLARLGARIAADPAIEADPLVALAAAFFTDGLIVTLAPGAAMARPLEIRHLSSGTAVSAFVRHAVTVGEGASAEIFESHESPNGVELHAHALIELTLGAGAEVGWLDRQREGDAAVRFSTLAVDLGERASLDHTVVTLGAKIARTQIFARLGAASHLATRGATLVKDRGHADATLVVTHAGPDEIGRAHV